MTGAERARLACSGLRAEDCRLNDEVTGQRIQGGWSGFKAIARPAPLRLVRMTRPRDMIRIVIVSGVRLDRHELGMKTAAFGRRRVFGGGW